MKKSNVTIKKIEQAEKNGFMIVGSGIGFGAKWAQRERSFENGLRRDGFTEFYRIAKTNCRKCGYTKRLIYAAK